MSATEVSCPFCLSTDPNTVGIAKATGIACRHPFHCPAPEVHGNPFRYCPYCSWTEGAEAGTEVVEVWSTNDRHRKVIRHQDGMLLDNGAPCTYDEAAHQLRVHGYHRAPELDDALIVKVSTAIRNALEGHRGLIPSDHGLHAHVAHTAAVAALESLCDIIGVDIWSLT